MGKAHLVEHVRISPCEIRNNDLRFPGSRENITHHVIMLPNIVDSYADESCVIYRTLDRLVYYVKFFLEWHHHYHQLGIAWCFHREPNGT